MSNTEVGTAWVTILPSAKDFAKLLRREVAKQFKGSNLDRMISDALGNARVRLPIEPVVDDIGRLDPIDVPLRPDRTALDDLRDTTERLLADMTATVRAELDAAGLRPQLEVAADRADDGVTARVGTDVDTGGLLARLSESVRAASRSVVARVRVEFDRARLDVDVRDAVGRIKVDSAGGRLGVALAGSTASSFGSAVQDAFRVPLQGLANNPFVSSAGALLGAGLAVAGSTAFAATFSAALIGGAGLGAIGLGALILKEDPQVKHAATRLSLTVQSVLKSAAGPLIQPFTEALEYLRWTAIRLGPELREMFTAIAPAIMPLVRGFSGFVEAAMPGVTALVRAATPFLKDLESTLPRLGRDIATFFEFVSAGGPGASQVFRDLLHATGLVLKAAGIGIVLFTDWYLKVRGAVTGTVGVFNWMRDQVTGSLARIRSAGSSLVSFLKGIPATIRNAVDLGSVLRSAGRALIQGLIDGIRSKVPSLEGTLNWVTSKIPDWKGPMDTDRRLLEPSGAAIMGGLIRGIHGERRALETELGSVTSLLGSTPLTSLPAAPYAPSAAGAARPVLDWAPGSTGDPLLDGLRELIRIRYAGSPDAALATESR